MSDRETWPPIRGTGWINVGRRGVRQVQRRTGDVGIDSKIEDLIEDATASPGKTSENVRRAWELYETHGRTSKRVAREARAIAERLVYVVLWLAVGAVLVIVSAYIWG